MPVLLRVAVSLQATTQRVRIETMKLEKYQRDYIKLLAKAGIGGTTEREVLWWLIQYAMNEVVTSGYVQKYVEMRDLVRKRQP